MAEEPDDADIDPQDDDADEPRDLEIARQIYEVSRGDSERLEVRRDRFLSQLSTTRTVAGAMATLFAGAIVIAGEPLSPALARADVRIALAVTVVLLALALISSVIPYFWPRWRTPPTVDDLGSAMPGLTPQLLFWLLAEEIDATVRVNSSGVAKLEAAVNLAAVLTTLSALGLLASAAMTVWAFQ